MPDGPGSGPASVPIWRDRVFVGLLAAALVGALLQITMGGAVRVTGSGDGCPDWPLCFGKVLPPLEYHALMEYAHRTIGALVGITAIGATLRVLTKHRRVLPVSVSVTGGLIGITVAGILGGAVVLSELDPGLRTLHLMLAESVALLLVHAAIATFYTSAATPQERISPPLIRWSAAGASLTLVALLTGSYAVWRGAGPVCGSWPLCGGAIVPQHELVWIHMTHRVVALAAAVPALVAAHLVLRRGNVPPGAEHARQLALATVTIVGAQILLGAANPWTGFAQWARVAHLTVATLQWAVMAGLLIALLLPRSRSAAAEPAHPPDDAPSTTTDVLAVAGASGITPATTDATGVTPATTGATGITPATTGATGITPATMTTTDAMALTEPTMSTTDATALTEATMSTTDATALTEATMSTTDATALTEPTMATTGATALTEATMASGTRP